MNEAAFRLADTSSERELVALSVEREKKHRSLGIRRRRREKMIQIPALIVMVAAAVYSQELLAVVRGQFGQIVAAVAMAVFIVAVMLALNTSEPSREENMLAHDLKLHNDALALKRYADPNRAKEVSSTTPA